MIAVVHCGLEYIPFAPEYATTPFSDEVKTLIDENAAQAAQKLKNKGETVYAGLCCTHFGYCKNIF